MSLVKKSFIILLVVLSSQAYGQEQLGARLKVTYEKTEDVKFYIYDAKFIVKAIDQQPSDQDLSCPELLLQSILSTTSQTWFDFNTYGGSSNSEKKKESYFAKIKSMNKETNYFELVHKLEFSIDGVKYCAVKYFITMEGAKEPIAAMTMMVLDQGRWYKTKDYIFSLGALSFLKIKSDKLSDLLYNSSKDAVLTDVKAKVVEGNAINFSKLSMEMNNWYNNKNEKYIQYFIDEKVW